MSQQIQNIIDADKKKSDALKQQIGELENLSRIVANTRTLLDDLKIPGAYAKTVYESQNWLENFHKGIQGQLSILKPLVPVEPKAVETAPAVSSVETPAAAAPEAEKKPFELEVK